MLAPDHDGAGDAHLGQWNQPVLITETGAGPGLPQQAAGLLQLPLCLLPGHFGSRGEAGGGWGRCLGCSLSSRHKWPGTPGDLFRAARSERLMHSAGRWPDGCKYQILTRSERKERHDILSFSANLRFTMVADGGSVHFLCLSCL